MEDEQYELVSKTTLKELRDENARLKKELSEQKNKQPTQQKQQKKEVDSSSIEKILKNQLQEFEKNQKQLLSDEFEEIKELNKSTLNNVLSNSQNLNTKLSGIIETMQTLVENLSTLLEEVSQNSSQNNIEEQFSKIKKELLESLNSSNNDNQENEEVLTKLRDIETFMENLKLLLSQVKPSDMSMNKNT